MTGGSVQGCNIQDHGYKSPRRRAGSYERSISRKKGLGCCEVNPNCPLGSLFSPLRNQYGRKEANVVKLMIYGCSFCNNGSNVYFYCTTRKKVVIKCTVKAAKFLTSTPKLVESGYGLTYMASSFRGCPSAPSIRGFRAFGVFSQMKQEASRCASLGDEVIHGGTHAWWWWNLGSGGAQKCDSFYNCNKCYRRGYCSNTKIMPSFYSKE